MPVTQVTVSPSSAADSSSASRNDLRVLHEQVDSLLGTSGSIFLVGLALTEMFATLLYMRSGNWGVLLWMALFNVWQIHRYRQSLLYARMPRERKDVWAAARGYCWGNGVASVMWGLVPWLFFPAGDPVFTSFMVLVLMGVASGGVASVSSYRPTVFFLVVPVLTLLASALWWQGGLLNTVLGAFMLAYMGLTLHLGLEQYRLLTESLRVRYEKEDLAQRLAEQVHKVEQASLEKTRFLASASHDLRQPLHSLGLFGASILMKLRGTPQEYLGHSLMQCVQALETSFNSMLDASRLDAGVVKAHTSAVSLSQMFRLLDVQFGRQAEQRGLALRLRSGSKWVQGDPDLLLRLLGNLVQNALKFTALGGVVVVARGTGARVSIEVWDSGVGMAEEELPRIFDEFYQLGNQARDRAQGLGMGLAIVKRLAQLMKADISVDSRPGKGTVFKLALESASAPEQLVHELTPQPQADVWRMDGVRVLLVDDEEVVRQSTAEALSEHGLLVTLASNQHEALNKALHAKASGQCAQVLITDFRLRDHEDGIALAQAVQAALGQALPTILITGDTDPQRMRSALASGLRVLYKPVGIETLLEEIRRLLAQTRPRDLLSQEAKGHALP